MAPKYMQECSASYIGEAERTPKACFAEHCRENSVSSEVSFMFTLTLLDTQLICHQCQITDTHMMCIDPLRPCAFWGYEAIYSSVLGANNVYFNEMCYCNEVLLRMLRLNEYILASISHLAH